MKDYIEYCSSYFETFILPFKDFESFKIIKLCAFRNLKNSIFHKGPLSNCPIHNSCHFPIEL